MTPTDNSPLLLFGNKRLLLSLSSAALDGGGGESRNGMDVGSGGGDGPVLITPPQTERVTRWQITLSRRFLLRRNTFRSEGAGPIAVGKARSFVRNL